MSDDLKRIEGKLDKLVDIVQENQVQLAEIAVSHKDHVEKQREGSAEVDQIQKELKPIRDHVSKVSFLAKYILVPIIGTILVGLTKVIFFS
jgi:chromosome segregation ATPase